MIICSDPEILLEGNSREIFIDSKFCSLKGQLIIWPSSMKQAWSFPTYIDAAVRGWRRESPRLKNKPIKKTPTKQKNPVSDSPAWHKEGSYCSPSITPLFTNHQRCGNTHTLSSGLNELTASYLVLLYLVTFLYSSASDKGPPAAWNPASF